MEIQDMKGDEVLDARGLSCPMPMLRTKKTIKNLDSGQILEVWGTDPGSKNDIPGFCEKNNHEFLGYEDTSDGYTRYLIKVG